ncbi:hypothetical protein DV736_g6066, partial [Chaetothyriales sp. CBS 134916]
MDSGSDFPKYLDGDVGITVTVSKTYQLHSSMLKRYSPWFAELLVDPPRLTAKTRHDHLPAFRLELSGVGPQNVGRFVRKTRVGILSSKACNVLEANMGVLKEDVKQFVRDLLKEDVKQFVRDLLKEGVHLNQEEHKINWLTCTVVDKEDLPCVVCRVQAKSAVGDRVLVVLEDVDEKRLYSQFWQDLESRDFQLSFESPKSDQLSLFRHGELAYDHLILTPPKSKGYGPALTPKVLLDYINAGGNVLLGLSSATSTPSAISSLLLELDIGLPVDRTSVVVDHFHYDTSSAPDKHDVLLLPRPQPLRPDVINFFGGDGVLALPNTVGQRLGNTSPLLAPILKAPATAYTYNPKDEGDSIEDVFATGSQLSLVSALQARNSARFVVLGSLDMLQDKWFKASVKAKDGKATKTANREFAQQLTEWVFKEVGVLKVVGVQHQLVEEASRTRADNSTELGFVNPQIYRIKNDVTFSITLSLYSHTHYVPFSPPPGDELQLEFSMLSPFHRLPLIPTSSDLNSTTFTATFTTPDQHGIFAFKVDYNRPFLTNVEEKRQVTVRHFAHDEWPRSFVITGAWPWVTGLWSVIGGFLILTVVWLYCDPQPIDKRRAELTK